MTITQTDLDRALAAHVEVLERCGITYAGRLEISSGSKANGIAYRLYRTGYAVPCDHRSGYANPLTGDCTLCGDTGSRLTTGHASPPIGSDYLGMTKREAYETLTARTAVIGETAYALRSGGQS